jgi:hypothetical protein
VCTEDTRDVYLVWHVCVADGTNGSCKEAWGKTALSRLNEAPRSACIITRHAAGTADHLLLSSPAAGLSGIPCMSQQLLLNHAKSCPPFRIDTSTCG